MQAVVEQVTFAEYATIRQASNQCGTTYEALRMWIKRHDIPTKKIGSYNLVRLADLTGYAPRKRN